MEDKKKREIEENEEINLDIKRQKKDEENNIHPLLIEGVLERVYSYLNVNNLKNARQVSKAWAAEGGKALLVKCFLRIPEDVQAHTYYFNVDQMNKFKAFTSLKANEVSMIPRLMIASFEDYSIFKQLGMLNNQVKSLKLNVGGNDKKLRWLDSLLNKLSNLDYITFDYSPHGFSDKVKNIKKVVQYMLSKSIKNNDETTKRVMTIGGMILHASSQQEFNMIGDWIERYDIKFRHISFSIDPKDFSLIPNFKFQLTTLIDIILKNSCETLEQVTFYHVEDYLDQLCIPQLKRLKSVSLQVMGSDAHEMSFPVFFNFMDEMPNLESLTICSGRGVKVISLIDDVGVCSSVTSLDISNLESEDLFQVLHTFPQLKVLHLQSPVLSKELFHKLWDLGKNLKELSLEIDLDHDSKHLDKLDSYFTGIEGWAVKAMKNVVNLKPKFFTQEVEDFRTWPSILNLESLGLLRIFFLGSGEETNFPSKILSIAAKYGFQRLIERDSQHDILIQIYFSHDQSPRFKAAFDDLTKIPSVEIVEY